MRNRLAGEVYTRRGTIQATETNGPVATTTAEVQPARMFGYATDLCSMTQGRATFSIEFACYRRTPSSVQEDLLARLKKQQQPAKG